MGISTALVALALGYLVFVSGSREKEGVRLLGQVIGVFVMIAALLAVFCSVMKCASSKNCPMMSKSNCHQKSGHNSMKSKGACPIVPSDSQSEVESQ